MSTALCESPYHRYTSEEYAVMACTGVIEASTTFCAKKGKGTKIVGACYCTNIPEMGSLLTCLHTNDYYNNKMVSYLGRQCSEVYPNTTLDAQFFDKVYQNASQYIITPGSDFNSSLISYSPITVKSKKVKTYYKAYYVRWNNFTLALNLGAGFYGLMGFFMLGSAIVNWTTVIFPGFAQKFNGTSSKWFRKYVTLTAAFKKDRNVPLKFFGVPVALIPTRMESIIVFLLWTYMILASSIGYKHVEGNPIWKRPMAELGRIVSDRTGVLALITYPMLILFAGRNNFLIYITRWNFSRFNIYHRNVSRMFFLLSTVHGVAISISAFGISPDKYSGRMKKEAVIWGTVATILMGFMMIQGMLVLRRKSYETFLIIHIVFAVFVLIGTHFHIVPYSYDGFTWSVVGLWVLDRAVRLLSIARFGIKDANVTLISGETLKVTVPKPRHWNAKPGQYAFVSFMTPLCFWQSHPFTMITETESEISFAIKVKGGVTLSLYKHLVSMPSQTATIKVCVEG
ncbi:hypothetical protein BABINDRAFT_42481, partial [Babjeviella inositovora NRRL Y-12698]